MVSQFICSVDNATIYPRISGMFFWYNVFRIARVESGLDDLDYLGHLSHFFGGLSGSHPQTKLSGCDPNF